MASSINVSVITDTINTMIPVIITFAMIGMIMRTLTQVRF